MGHGLVLHFARCYTNTGYKDCLCLQRVYNLMSFLALPWSATSDGGCPQNFFIFFSACFFENPAAAFFIVVLWRTNLWESQVSFSKSLFFVLCTYFVTWSEDDILWVACIHSVVEIKPWGRQWCASWHSHGCVGDLNPQLALAATGGRLPWVQFYHSTQCC